MKTTILFAAAVITTWTVTAQPLQKIEVPFDFSDLEIVMDVHINDMGPYKMLLDTGCSTSFLDPSVARSLGLKVSTRGQTVQGPGAKSKGFGTKLDRVRVGTLEVRNVEALVADNAEAAANHYDGCLGYKFLKAWAVQIDYPQRTVSFLVNSPALLPDDVIFQLHDTNIIDNVGSTEFD